MFSSSPLVRRQDLGMPKLCYFAFELGEVAECVGDRPPPSWQPAADRSWRSTPLSVSMSRNTSRFCRKVLLPASVMAPSLSSTGRRVSFCAIRAFASQGTFSPLMNLTFATKTTLLLRRVLGCLERALWRRRAPPQGGKQQRPPPALPAEDERQIPCYHLCSPTARAADLFEYGASPPETPRERTILYHDNG